PEVVRAHERVRLVRNVTNLGPAGARNRGVAESRGELLVFLDSDSIVDDTQWLARHAGVHAAGGAAVVGGGIRGVGRGPVARADWSPPSSSAIAIASACRTSSGASSSSGRIASRSVRKIARGWPG